MTEHTTTYSSIRKKLQNGDMMVRRRKGMVSWISRNPASHVGMLVWRLADQDSLSVAESLEGKGGRVVSLSSQISKYPGLIDIYRPNPLCPRSLKERAATICYNWAGRCYNYPGIFQLGIVNAPIIRFLAEKFFRYKPNFLYLDDKKELTPWDAPKFCSQLYAWSFRWAIRELKLSTGWDPVPGIADPWIIPASLISSGSFLSLFKNLVP